VRQSAGRSRICAAQTSSRVDVFVKEDQSGDNPNARAMASAGAGRPRIHGYICVASSGTGPRRSMHRRWRRFGRCRLGALGKQVTGSVIKPGSTRCAVEELPTGLETPLHFCGAHQGWVCAAIRLAVPFRSVCCPIDGLTRPKRRPVRSIYRNRFRHEAQTFRPVAA